MGYMDTEINQNHPQKPEGFAKKHCFLCAMARYLTAFALGIILGFIWAQF